MYKHNNNASIYNNLRLHNIEAKDDNLKVIIK